MNDLLLQQMARRTVDRLLQLFQAYAHCERSGSRQSYAHPGFPQFRRQRYRPELCGQSSEKIPFLDQGLPTVSGVDLNFQIIFEIRNPVCYLYPQFSHFRNVTQMEGNEGLVYT